MFVYYRVLEVAADDVAVLVELLDLALNEVLREPARLSHRAPYYAPLSARQLADVAQPDLIKHLLELVLLEVGLVDVAVEILVLLRLNVLVNEKKRVGNSGRIIEIECEWEERGERRFKTRAVDGICHGQPWATQSHWHSPDCCPALDRVIVFFQSIGALRWL